MKRDKRIVLVAHCLLNCNSKVEGLAQYQGALREIVNPILEAGVGIIQLPCPELTLYGTKRWGHVKEQFDTPYFREHCREIFGPYLRQIKDYLSSDYQIIGLIGVDGSPSCGVNKTCSSNRWGGEFLETTSIQDKIEDLDYSNNSGVFIEEIRQVLNREEIDIPLLAIDETEPKKSKEKIKELLQGGLK